MGMGGTAFPGGPDGGHPTLTRPSARPRGFRHIGLRDSVAMHPDDVLDRLDPEQRAAAQAVRGPVCILAGAGTGKTRTITHRIAYAVLTGAVQPDHVLAVTFTARAA